MTKLEQLIVNLKKLKRESFTIDDLDKIADVTGSTFERKFILSDGETI